MNHSRLFEKEAEILVFGTINIDYTSIVKRMPLVGETLSSDYFSEGLGGKAANQAISAIRMGGKVALVGKVGNDENGTKIIKKLKEEGVNKDNIYTSSDTATGNSMIIVDRQGENFIITNLEANKTLFLNEVKASEPMMKEAKIALLQLEADYEVREYLIKLLSENNMKIVVNLAPVVKISTDALKLVDVLIVNEIEASQLLDKNISNVQEAMQTVKELAFRENQKIIITLGADGVVVYNDQKVYHMATPHVENVVDTSGAGDCFCGSLVTFWLKENFDVAIKKAMEASSICITKKGTFDSFPYVEELSQ